MDVVEVLETIFLNLALTELLLPVPLVCRQWRDTIIGSPRLQQSLCLSPIPRVRLSLDLQSMGGWVKNEYDEH